MRNLGYLLLIGLVVYCVIDIVRSEDDERLGVHPALWVLLVVLIPILGSIVWLAVSRTRRAGRPATAGGRTSSGPSRGPVAPDDDPEFLWRLEQERRRAQQGDDAPEDKPTAG
ncbi:PLD nuclease N-terminal domain-containing protein [Cellulomonas composti]|uniref:Cardiolipin synthase N-terminal domain-containing protein n=1 Tax=Cellulomonas composti TaxID=266130 RepID=A0A511JF67_9CELL|nr:PLD nuclease N-terminal domain-containing protein [Cellulomonas composti]GEL96373.1 hypothetical protein CCO02nite_30310 [Cellulomonas composti]